MRFKILISNLQRILKVVKGTIEQLSEIDNTRIAIQIQIQIQIQIETSSELLTKAAGQTIYFWNFQSNAVLWFALVNPTSQLNMKEVAGPYI